MGSESTKTDCFNYHLLVSHKVVAMEKLKKMVTTKCPISFLFCICSEMAKSNP